MSGGGSAVKRREWAERLRRFARWGGTVAEFCDGERVSAPSFYQWRRKLAASGAGVEADLGAGQRAAAEGHGTRETPRTFVPVQLVSATSAAARTVEIRLPNGARVRLPGDDRQLLAAAIVAAGQVSSGAGQPTARQEEPAPC